MGPHVSSLGSTGRAEASIDHLALDNAHILVTTRRTDWDDEVDELTEFPIAIAYASPSLLGLISEQTRKLSPVDAEAAERACEFATAPRPPPTAYD